MPDREKADPPDVGQGEAILKDDQQPPGIGQGEVVELATGEIITSDTPPDTGQGGDEGGTPESKLQAFMKKKGIKDPDELVNLYENVESQNTRLSQQIRSNQMPPVYHTPPPNEQRQKRDLEIPDDPTDLFYDKKRLKEFMGTFAQQVRDETLTEVQKEEQKKHNAFLYNQIVKKMEKDPQKFARLQNTMIHLSAQYPNADLDFLYDEADKLQTEDRKRYIEEMRRELLGDIPPERLKVIADKSRPVPISEGGELSGSDLTNPHAKILRNARALKGAIFGPGADILDA